MTRKRNFLCTGLCTATLLLAATGAMAGKVTRTENTPGTGGQLNRCWGEIASQLAQLPTDGIDANGGAMGLHSKDNAAPDTTFRDAFTPPDTNNRLGIGNGTADVNGPHAVAPGDGGLGQHAINNGSTTTDGQVTFFQGTPFAGLGFSTLNDPRTGGPADPTVSLECSLAPSNQVP
jgi:hypothetical protein